MKNMKLKDARRRWEKLAGELRRHDELYYQVASPGISDREYDELLRELEDLEKAHPELACPESPTQRVGGRRDESFPSFTHPLPMLSLSNTYSFGELQDFFDRVSRALPEGVEPSWSLEPKVDGVALSLHYEKGALQAAATRGDGKKGDEVTANARHFLNIPSVLRETLTLEVRGEAYLDRERFHHLNRVREEAGEEPFANPRNLAAGTLKLLDTRELARRGLSFVAHAVLGDLPGESHSELMNELEGWGIASLPLRCHCKNRDEVLDGIRDLDARRNELPFEIDGAVVKVDELGLREKLGVTSKSPRWGIAFKYEAEQAESRILEITLQVGRTGVVTPVAELEPVQLSGTTVKRATLHNREEIERKDIRVGDVVLVEKGGEIIPKVLRVLAEHRQGSEKGFVFPEHCPSCQSPLVKREEEVAVRCENPACPAQLRRRLSHFAGRDAMDIAGLGQKWIDLLMEEGLIQSLPDIYRFEESRLLELDRMGEKSVENLLASLGESKKRAWSRKIFALGIRHVGAETARALARHYADLESLRTASLEDLQAIEDVGPVVAASLLGTLQEAAFLEELEALASLGFFEHSEEEAQRGVQDFAGETIVITGTLQEFGRRELKETLIARGAKVASSVSPKTTLLIAGEKAGSKRKKAEELGIEIWEEERLLRELS